MSDPKKTAVSAKPARTPEFMLAVGRQVAAKAAPWFRGVLLALVPIPDPQVETCGVTPDFVLRYNPEWIAQQEPAEMAAIMTHEALHLVLDHHGRRNGRQHDIWNIAGDLAINEMVTTMGLKMPSHALRAAQFNLPTDLTADAYYAEILKKAKVITVSGVGCGNCGSGAGHPTEGDNPGAGEKHEEGRTPSGAKRVRDGLAQAIRDSQGSREAGTIPGELARWADVQLSAPKVPWQQRLAKWARQQTAARRGMRDYTYSRVARRQWGLPPDFPRLPSMVDNEVRAVVAVDTSGSMSDRELALGLSEIQAVLEQCGLKARAIVCDAEIHEDCEISSAAELRKKLKGGGGTDFRPIFDRIAKGRKPDVLVFVTDGYGPAPEHPPGYGMIWLLVGQGAKPPVAWGDAINLE